MAQLSRGPPKDRPFDGASQLSENMKRTLGDLGEDFPKLRKDIDLANDDIARVKKFQKYLRENMITGIQSQMKIAMALKAEGVLTDRVWYTVHTLIAGNAISKDLKDPFQPISAPINKKR